MKYLTLCLILILIGNSTLKGQDFSLKKAKVNKNKITICFYNSTNSTIIVPILKNRVGLDSKFMYEEYFSVHHDTLELNITKQVDKKLYTLISREGNTTSTSYFVYNDKMLKSRRTYKSIFRIKDLPPVSVINLNGKIINVSPHCR